MFEDRSKGRYYNREQGISCLCLWGVYIPTKVLRSTEELCLGDIVTKEVAGELGSEEQVIQEVEIAKSKGLETCSWNNENSSPHHLYLHPSFLPSFHLISERVILSHRRKRAYSEYLPPSPSRPPAFVSHPTSLHHNFLLSPKHPSRVALCKCKHMWISFLISLFYFTESMPIILEKDETLMQMKHRFGAPGKQGTMGRD